MQFGDCFTTGGFDGAQCLGCPCRLSYHHPSGTSGLHSDHTHVMRHDIVKFAGDAHPFGEHRLSGVLLALGSELDGLVGQCALPVSQGPDSGSKQPGEGEHDHVV